MARSGLHHRRRRHGVLDHDRGALARRRPDGTAPAAQLHARPRCPVQPGAFLGTFSYALMVLRSVRTQEEGAFTPHLSLTRRHPPGVPVRGDAGVLRRSHGERINVDTVIELVSADVDARSSSLTLDERPRRLPPLPSLWKERPRSSTAGAAICRSSMRAALPTGPPRRHRHPASR